jgi:copper transport protein
MKQKLYTIVILLGIALFMLPLPVSAHARIVQSFPEANARLQYAPAEIKLQYSEDFDAGLSKITLKDGNGKLITGKLSTASGRWLIYQIPSLAKGSYTVHYQVLSVDTHLTEGSFKFSVTEGKPAATSAASSTPEPAAGMGAGLSPGSPSPASPPTLAPAPTSTTQPEVVQPIVTDAEANAAVNSSSGIVYSLLRILDLLTAVAAAGFVIFRYAVWGNMKLGVPSLFSVRKERILYIAAFAVLSLSGLLHAGMLANELSGSGAGLPFGSALWRVLTGTMIGAAVWLRPAAAAVLIMTVWGTRSTSRSALIIKAAAIVIIIGMFPLTGHAYGASSGALTAVLLHILHMGAAAVWFGGLAGILIAIQVREQSGLNYGQLHRLILRFSAMALPSVVIIAGSGIVLALLRIGSWSGLFHSTYGRLVLAKSGLVLLILVIAAFHRLVLIPQMNKRLAPEGADSSQKLPAKFILGFRIEVILALITFALAGALSTTSPPVQALTAAPVYWHEMGETVHMSMRVNFQEQRGQKLQLDTWLPSGTGAPAQVEVQLTHSGADHTPVNIPMKYISGGPDPYGFEGFDKFTYEAEGHYFTEKGEWKATIKFTDSKGGAYNYEKIIIL